MTELASFIAGLPKAELHVHHVGSASPRIVAELAARHEGSSPVPADPAALAARLADAYPVRNGRVAFPFRRVFVVAQTFAKKE